MKLEQLFTSTGRSGGAHEMAATADTYRVAPPSKYTYEIHRINVCIEDDVALGGDLYSGLAALTNGIMITSKHKGIVTTHTPLPITKSGHWGLLAGVDMVMTDFIAANNDILLIRWTMAKYGGPVILDGSDGDYMQIEVRDDLSNIVSHIAQAQGQKYWSS